MLKPGDPVVYHMSKVSTDPGPRAHDVHPAEFGETYRYLVDKYWKVADVLTTGQVVLVTRRGKRHVVTADDPRLRPARWWERWLYRRRFPDLSNLNGTEAPSQQPEKLRA
jgi:hypothetical protein